MQNLLVKVAGSFHIYFGIQFTENHFRSSQHLLTECKLTDHKQNFSLVFKEGILNQVSCLSWTGIVSCNTFRNFY